MRKTLLIWLVISALCYFLTNLHWGYTLSVSIAFASTLLTYRHSPKTAFIPILVLFLFVGLRLYQVYYTPAFHSIIYSAIVMNDASWESGGACSMFDQTFPPSELVHDFMAATLVGDYGFRILAPIIVLYLGLIAVVMRTTRRSILSKAGPAIGIGFCTMITAQTVIHIGVNWGLLPIKSPALPLVSWAPFNIIFLLTWLLFYFRVIQKGVGYCNRA